ncbi:MAG: phospholipid carrier-dependent glycosyltransferase [Candidatus Acidiferrales bacterium]
MDNSSPPQQRLNYGTAAVAAAVILITLLGHLGAMGLVGPDEPRYGWIARAMAATGDWVTPRLYGQPWFEKPVLYYWAGAIGFLLHLPAEWALRLPSALAGLAAAWAMGWLAWKHYAAGATRLNDPAVLAPLFFSTTVAAIGFSRAATPDMLFSASIALAMASVATVFRLAGFLRADTAASGSPQAGDRIPLLLWGAFLGLGVLAKGPAAILLAGGAVTLWALCTRNWRPVFRLAHPYAILSFCVIALPWYVLCAIRNPDFVRVFILEQNFERYLTPVFQHRQPFWFFGPITLLALLPWTALLWPIGQQGLRLWRARSWNDSPGLFFSCWALFPVLFFSFSQSKLPSYILPAVPALALLCAAARVRAASRVSEPGSRTSHAMHAAAGLTWVILGLAALIGAHRVPGAASHSILMAAGLSIVGGIGGVAVSFLRERGVVLYSVFLMVFLVEFANLSILPPLDPYVSARWHAQLMHSNLHPDRIFAYHLSRSWTYGLSFYFARELPEWSPSDPDPALVLTTPAGLGEIRHAGRFYGDLEEAYQGILYVPIGPLPR